MTKRAPPFSLLFLTASPGIARAEAAVAESGIGVLQVLFALAFVIAMIVGSLWLMRRLQSAPGAGSPLVKVVAAAAVGPRERVTVVEVAGRWLVVGVAPGRVTALAELPRGEAPGGRSGAETSAVAPFAELLRHVRRQV